MVWTANYTNLTITHQTAEALLSCIVFQPPYLQHLKHVCDVIFIVVEIVVLGLWFRVLSWAETVPFLFIYLFFSSIGEAKFRFILSMLKWNSQ